MTLMRDEVLQAPEAVARLLARSGPVVRIAERLRTADPSLLVVCARGSSSHAGTFLRYVFARDRGLVTAAAMPAIASIYGRRQRMAGALFLAISQSGRSPDLIRQTVEARAAGALCVALVNDPSSPIAEACELVLDVGAGPERSVAATKSVLCTIAAGLAVAAAWGADDRLAASLARLPDRIAQAAGLDWSALAASLVRTDRCFVLGRGPGFGVAKEAALKMAETAGITGIAHSSAEFSHGPMALAGPGFPVLAIRQEDASRPSADTLLAELASRSVPVLATGTPDLPTLPTDHPDTDLLPLLASLYLAVEAAARGRGHDPDHPPSLHKVTRTL